MELGIVTSVSIIHLHKARSEDASSFLCQSHKNYLCRRAVLNISMSAMPVERRDRERQGETGKEREEKVNSSRAQWIGICEVVVELGNRIMD